MMAQSDAHVQLADDPSDLTQENDTGRSCPVDPMDYEKYNRQPTFMLIDSQRIS